MLKQMCMNAYLKEAVSVTSLNYQNMGDEVGGYDVKHIQKELNYYICRQGYCLIFKFIF